MTNPFTAFSNARRAAARGVENFIQKAQSLSRGSPTEYELQKYQEEQRLQQQQAQAANDKVMQPAEPMRTQAAKSPLGQPLGADAFSADNPYLSELNDPSSMNLRTVRRKAARWEQQKLWDQEAAARAAQPPMQQY